MQPASLKYIGIFSVLFNCLVAFSIFELVSTHEKEAEAVNTLHLYMTTLHSVVLPNKFEIYLH